jgi:hypothetical protein
MVTTTFKRILTVIANLGRLGGDAAGGSTRRRPYRPSLEWLEARDVPSAGSDLWYLSSNPTAPFNYGQNGWVPVGLGDGTYAVVDTSGNNSVAPGQDVWYPSTNPSHPFGFGASGWVPVGLGNGTFAAVDTSGDNSASLGNDVWYVNSNPTHPFGFGGAGFVPVGLGNGTFAAVDTSGRNTVAPRNDVWYVSTNPSHPFGFGASGWVPVGLGNGNYAVVDTSGNNTVYLTNDIWYLSTNPSHPFNYGAAGWVPVGLGTTGSGVGTYAVVDTSGGSPAAPISQSGSWSGYAVSTVAGALSDIRGSWYVPTVSGTANAYSSTWVGIDGFNSSTVEQIGTEADIIGSPYYYAWYEMYPNPLAVVPHAISPGDLMAANVSYVGGGNFNLDISDLTQNWSWNTTQALPAGHSAQRSSAEWIEESPLVGGNVQPLANFGSVTLSNMQATISGGIMPVYNGNIDDQGNTNNILTLVDPKGGVATASQLNYAGNSFTVSYGSSTPGAPSTGPGVWYAGPMQRLSMASGMVNAATVLAQLAQLSPVAPFAIVVGGSGSVPSSTPADPPVLGVQPGTRPFAFVGPAVSEGRMGEARKSGSPYVAADAGLRNWLDTLFADQRVFGEI